MVLGAAPCVDNMPFRRLTYIYSVVCVLICLRPLHHRKVFGFFRVTSVSMMFQMKMKLYLKWPPTYQSKNLDNLFGCSQCRVQQSVALCIQLTLKLSDCAGFDFLSQGKHNLLCSFLRNLSDGLLHSEPFGDLGRFPFLLEDQETLALFCLVDDAEVGLRTKIICEKKKRKWLAILCSMFFLCGHIRMNIDMVELHVN